MKGGRPRFGRLLGGRFLGGHLPGGRLPGGQTGSRTDAREPPARAWRDLPGAQRLAFSLLLAVTIPILLFAGWIAYVSAQQESDNARQTAFKTVERVAERVAAKLNAEVQVLEALAASTTLDASTLDASTLDGPDLPAFYREAERIKALRPLWHTVELAAPSGTQLVNLLRPMGDPLAATADRDSFDKVVQTRETVVGGIGPIGPISGRRLVTLRIPVMRDGELRYTLSIGIAPDEISAVLRQAGAPPNWIGSVIDASGRIVARTLAERTELGFPAGPSARLAVLRAPDGFYKGLTLEGIEVDTVYRTLPGTGGWSVHFGIPSELLHAPVRRSLYVLAMEGGVSMVLAMILVFFVARDLAQRRRDEQQRADSALRASEERRLMAVEAAALGTWQWDLREDRLDLSAQAQALLAPSPLPPGEDAGSGFAIARYAELLDMLHPEDRPVFDEAVRRCRDEDGPIDIEFRIMRSDGIHWLRAIGRAHRSGSGEARYIHGVIADVDSRKRADGERLQLLRRLAQVQEDERRRIARELHDQVGQTVTGLSLGLKGLEESIRRVTTSDELRERTAWLQELAAEIGRDIHRAASDLRPTALDDLGLYRALKAHAADWSARYGIAADVQSVGNLRRLPTEVETILYRIVQEALTNVLKHAAARNVSILLEKKGDQVRVIIEDDGRGFDTTELTRDPLENGQMGNGQVGDGPDGRPRLGLSGIHERLSLIDGTMTIESMGTVEFMGTIDSTADATGGSACDSTAGGGGTTLFIQVPLPRNAAGAAP